MKHHLALLRTVIVTLCSASVLAAGGPKEQAPVPVIFDTDMGPDYDDVGALAILHALANRGEAKILATVTSNRLPASAPVIEIINRYYGRPAIPIGAPKGHAINADAWHRGKKWTVLLPESYAHILHSTADAADAVAVYREVLAQQPDHSVSIVVVGAFTNVRGLLSSTGDAYSRLSGEELVRQKVTRLVCMGGKFPDGLETNVSADAGSSRAVFTQWPTPIAISGYEVGRFVRTGDRLIEQTTSPNPIADVYRMSIEQDRLEQGNSRYEPGGRASYDQTAVLEAVRPGRYFQRESGTLTVRDDGSDTWTSKANGPHQRLLLKLPAKDLAKVIEDLMMEKPNASATAAGQKPAK